MATDPRDYKLDLSTHSSGTNSAEPRTQQSPRPFVSVHFTCCGDYTRIYRTPDATAYRGRCPRCARLVQFRVGENGTDARFFAVH
jgi:hypothetical protein